MNNCSAALLIEESKMHSNSMKINKVGEFVYLTFPSFEQFEEIRHGFTTRHGGVSTGCLESMNLGFGRGDSKENILKNYEVACSAMGLDYSRCVVSDQVHEDEIRIVDEQDCGKGLVFKKDYKGIDGLITDKPNVPLVTLYADCVPLFFYDPVRKVIGTAHAGWRGTVRKIGSRMISKFVEVYGSKAEDIWVAIAPSIGPCCYEVDQVVKDEFMTMDLDVKPFIEEKSNGKYHIDLWGINRAILIDAGVLEGHISVTDLCTKCNKEEFFSHRGHNGKRGNMAAIISLN